MPAPMNHASGVRLASAIELILSVTEANVCPAPITDGGDMVVSLRSVISSCIIHSQRVFTRTGRSLLLRQFRIRGAHRRQISRSRLRVQFSKQAVVPLFTLQL